MPSDLQVSDEGISVGSCALSCSDSVVKRVCGDAVLLPSESLVARYLGFLQACHVCGYLCLGMWWQSIVG